MDLYLVSVLVFVAFLAVFVYKDRKKFKRESIFLMRRTKRGRGVLVWLGTRFPRFWKVVGFFSVATGFVVSVLGLKMLIDTLAGAIASGSSTPSLALLLPSPTAEPVFGYGYLAVPFWYWIICIALLALVHEGFHGIFTAREKTKIKSMGFGILAVIPLAFVEPDEKQLSRKGVWPQLRVFSAGSFANFLLAALSIGLLAWLASTAYVASGVDFQTYPYVTVNVSSIDALGTHSVSSLDDIVSVLQEFGENETIMVTVGNDSYYLKRRFFDEQLKEGAISRLVLFDDYPAAKAGLEGTIVSLDGMKVTDVSDLSLALEKAGVGSTVTVSVMDGGQARQFQLQTVPSPYPVVYTPDSVMYVFVALEHVVPGSISAYEGMGDALLSLSGQDMSATWNYAKRKVELWEWVGDNYPELSERAGKNAAAWEAVLAGRNEPGFIGVLNVMTHYNVVEGLEMFGPALDFIQGLLAFLIIINLGVGIVNLLPMKPLDGGKMWDIVLQRYLPKHSARIMKAIGILVLLILLANFIPFGMLF